MVVFTCNGCGESLRKNQVEKHYMFQCRRCEVLSCIDCGKDFPGDAYLTHTACISEAEKYQKADYKPKPGANKGMRKQNSWVQTVAAAVKRARTNGASRQAVELLDRIKAFDNVPQNEKKFVNFVQNCVKVSDPKIAAEAFQQLRAAFADNSKGESAATSAHSLAEPVSAKTPKMEEEVGEIVDADIVEPNWGKRKFDFVNEAVSLMRKRQKSDFSLDVLDRKLYKIYKKAAASESDAQSEAPLLDADRFKRKLSRKLRRSALFAVTDNFEVILHDHEPSDEPGIDSESATSPGTVEI